jgi:serine/threonine protein kinase
MAPEIALRQKYSKSIDVWACGIIMYNLISGGLHPLHTSGQSFDKFHKKLQNQEPFHFTDAFSELARDLITKMTSYSSVNRYSIDQVLNHPWITRSHDTKVPLTCNEMFKIMDIEDKLKKVG